jgi:hypothetical protein
MVLQTYMSLGFASTAQHVASVCGASSSQIIVVMALLIRVLTVWPALAGLGVTIAIIPTTMLLGKLLTSARRESMAAADQRIKLMTEVITGAWLLWYHWRCYHRCVDSRGSLSSCFSGALRCGRRQTG